VHPPTVTPEEARTAVAAGALLLDVREQEEWELAHVPGAVLIPLSELRGRWDELPFDGSDVVVMCRSGARSGQVVAAVAGEPGASGYRNLDGGILAWHAAGLPLEPPGAVPS
jgi:rhodanese-related sulfurtransferase